MPPRLQLSYWPRIFPRTVAKTCVLALGLLLWIAYLYSGSYVQDERPRASDNRTLKHGTSAVRRQQSDDDILRRPTVPVFEGAAPDSAEPLSRCSGAGGAGDNATRNCSGAPRGDETNYSTVALKNLSAVEAVREADQSNSQRTLQSSRQAGRPSAPPPPSLPVSVKEVRRGDYVVLQQVIRARRSFGYDKSITLTTHATYELLDNLLELSRRWDGPVSVAVYAPHDDFRDSLLLALWLRRCHQTVAELVTFHFVYPAPGVDFRVPTLRPPKRPAAAKSDARNSSRVEDRATPSLPPADRCPAANLTSGNDSAGCNANRSPTAPVPPTTEEPVRPYDYVRVLLEVLKADPSGSAGVPCNAPSPPPPSHPSGRTYRSRHRLPYPINVCRNAARLTARTHFVLASDIELYPSAGVIPMFLNYSRRTGIAQSPPVSTAATGSSSSSTGAGGGARPQAAPPAQQQQPSSLLASLLMSGGGGGGQGSVVGQPAATPAKTRRVFVLPIFEVERSVREAPSNKRALVELYRRKKAVYFHKYVCSFCNIIPRLNRWLTAPVPRGSLNLFMTMKRQKPFNRWEPIYIGTNEDPQFNELLTWEGQQDKMTQMYEICLLNYDLAILDNAFLVHRPGIKRKNATEYRLKSPYISQNNKIYKTVIRQLEKKHGINPWCK